MERPKKLQGQQSNSGAKEMWSLGSGGWVVRSSVSYRRNGKVSNHIKDIRSQISHCWREDFNYVKKEN